MMELRIGDSEREAAASRLGDDFAAGRLDHAEFDERLDAIWSARTRADLDQLFWDLPAPAVRLTHVRQAPVARRRLPPIVPFVLVVLIAMAVFKAGPWIVLIALVWLVFLRPRRRDTRGRRDRLGINR